MRRPDVPVRIRNSVVQIDIEAAVGLIVRISAEQRKLNANVEPQNPDVIITILLFVLRMKGRGLPSCSLRSQFTLPYKWFARKRRPDVPGRIRNSGVQKDIEAAGGLIGRRAAEQRKLNATLTLVEIITIISC